MYLNKSRAVTLVGENDRKMLKAVIKHSSDQDNIRHRLIPTEAISKMAADIDSMKDEVTEILQEEKQEKEVGADATCLDILGSRISSAASRRTRHQEGGKHDRAREGDLLSSSSNMVSIWQGQGEGRGYVPNESKDEPFSYLLAVSKQQYESSSHNAKATRKAASTDQNKVRQQRRQRGR
jgi:hypothetical protein